MDRPQVQLPDGITSRQIDTNPHSLSFHILESGHANQPLICLLHGFPELAYSWRKCMPLLAREGYHVIAPDQRGYGRTTGWDDRDYANVNLQDFSPLNLVKDIVVLVHSLGYSRVRCLVGHDFGAVAAALCAVARPDVFENLVLMSHPFKGIPVLPKAPIDIQSDLASLGRKHYKWYFSTAAANKDLSGDGLHRFLRGYFHLKSADWKGNNPHPLKAWNAQELAKMPRYYIMDKDDGMRQSVEKDMADEDAPKVASRCKWLTDEELDVYAKEWARNGFQGGLNWYRVQTGQAYQKDAMIFAGKKIEVPCIFVSGQKDWGTYQEPGVVEKMSEVCTDFRGAEIVKDAGHWLPQEKPEDAVKWILHLINT
ncbi:MAG: hypothetical protein Q9227_004425 [Pyrenula ochraceoflavens]